LKDNIGIMLKGIESSENESGNQVIKTLNFPSIKLLDDLDSIITENAEADCKIYYL
jgi:hypothetical protein